MPDRYSSRQKAAHFIEGFANYKKTGVSQTSVQNLGRYCEHLKNLAEAPDAGEEISQYYQDLMAFYDLCKKAGEALALGYSTKDQLEQDLIKASEKADSISDHLEKFGSSYDPNKEYSSDKIKDESNLTSLYEGYWTKEKKFNGESVLSQIGPSKSAAKWIDDYKNGIKKGQPVSEDTVAKIFAARQLANAVFGKRKNIDNKKLTQAEIDAQAYQLKNSGEFKEFIKKNQPINAAILDGNHGGKLERKFEEFLIDNRKKQIEDAKKEGKELSKLEMDFDAHERYKARIDDNIKSTADFEVLENPFKKKAEPKKEEPVFKEGSPKHQYTTYLDYIGKNKTNFEGTVSPEYHAAKMAAADALRRKDPYAPFDRKEFDKKTREYMKDPGFKLVVKVPGNLEMINKGDFEGFAKATEEAKLSCDAMFDERRDIMNDNYIDDFRPKGYVAPMLNKLEEAAKNDQELQTIVDNVDDLYKEGKHDSSEIMKTIASITDYQDKYGHINLGPKAKNVNDTLRLLNEIVDGRSISGIVDTQIEKINKSRGLGPEDHRFLTKEYIQAAGKEEQRKAEQRLGLVKEEPLDNGPDEEAPEDLNKGFNLGHKEEQKGPMFNF